MDHDVRTRLPLAQGTPGATQPSAPGTDEAPGAQNSGAQNSGVQNSDARESGARRGSHTCGCGRGGGHCRDDVPELDARVIPHPVRHAAVLGAIGSLEPGQSLVLVAPHDPKPLLRAVRETLGAFDVAYLQEGPDAWRLLLTREAG